MRDEDSGMAVQDATVAKTPAKAMDKLNPAPATAKPEEPKAPATGRRLDPDSRAALN